MDRSVIYWRRIDTDGIERLVLDVGHDVITADSTVVCLESGGFRLKHKWQLDLDWRVRQVTVNCWNIEGHGALHLQRSGTGWRVDGQARADLEGAAEPDLSVTPLCNTFAIRKLQAGSLESLTLDTAFIDGPALTVERSKQRYDRQGDNRYRYIDLGLSAGFEADLLVDDDGLISSYEHLFERAYPD